MFIIIILQTYNKHQPIDSFPRELYHHNMEREMLNMDGLHLGFILQATNIYQHLCATQQGVAEREDLWHAEEASEQTVNMQYMYIHTKCSMHCTAH